MGLGFLGGFIRGLIVGGFALACVSLYLGNTSAPIPERTEVEVPAGSEFTFKREDTAVQRPKPIEQTTTAPAPEVTAPSVEISLIDAAEMSDAPVVPETGLVDTTSPTSPETGLVAPAAPERPRLPKINSALPSRPHTEAQSEAPTQPKIERDDAGAKLAPSLGSGPIVVPSDPTSPEFRHVGQAAPSKDTDNATVHSNQTDETGQEQVSVEAIKSE